MKLMMKNALDTYCLLFLDILGGFPDFGSVHIELLASVLDGYTFSHVLDSWRDVILLIY